MQRAAAHLVLGNLDVVAVLREHKQGRSIRGAKKLRHHTGLEEGDATAIRVFEDELILFNMSVWESIEALEEYAYRSAHVEAVRARGNWFEPMRRPTMILWWIPAGHIPSVEEARERFSMLWQHGPTSEAFTFSSRFGQSA